MSKTQTSQRNPIYKWALDDRPREKILAKGPWALSNAELLAILLITGSKEGSAVDLGKNILEKCQNDLNVLGNIGYRRLKEMHGIGDAKAAIILAALELGRRREGGLATSMTRLKDYKGALRYFQSILKDETREVFLVVYLNQRNSVVHWEEISRGGLTSTIVDIRIILRTALDMSAMSLILCHNHPSGTPHPSPMDIEVTKKIKAAAALMDIYVMDHLIIAGRQCYSFANEGVI